MRLSGGLLILVAVGLTGCTFSILVQTHTGPSTDRFLPWIDQIDLNGDRQIDSLEYRQVAGGGPDFAVYDLDGNGRIDVTELEKGVRWVDPLWMYADPE